MKTQLKGFGLICLFMTAAVFANAQSGHSALVVSKGVQQVANKKSFENEESRNSSIQATSMAFPAIVVSKGVLGTQEGHLHGNVVSRGYPAWAISKGVARINTEATLETPTNDDKDRLSPKGIDQVTRK